MALTDTPVRVRICWPCAVIAMLAIFFALYSLWMGLDTGYRRWTVLQGAIGIFGFALVGSLGVSILLPALFRYPIIVGDHDSISFKTAFFMSGRVLWRDTVSVRAVSLDYAKYVVVDLADVNAFINAQPFLFRSVLRYCAKGGWPTCMILVDCRKNSTVHRDIAASLRQVRKRALNQPNPSFKREA